MNDTPGSASFVIPTMNEEDTIATLVEQIDAVCGELGLRHDILFVDDGSTDQTWPRIVELAERLDHVRGFRFRRNFGKAAALAAGFARAEGEVVFTLDADLQDDPVEIPKFLDKLAEGNDVVSGWKQKRNDPLDKTLPSKVFNWLVSRLTGVKLNDHNCGFKAYRQAVTKDVTLYGERHRFVPVLAAARGWRIGEVPVVHHARQFGQSKYGVSRLAKGFLDLLSIFFLTTFGKRPFHFIGAIGMLFFITGGLGMVYLSCHRILSWQIESLEDFHLHRSPLFYYCITALLLGSQLFLAGLLSELIVSLSEHSKSPYSIAEETETTDERG
ncbi:glycosyltransferase family 2 protein [Roseiconus lacunae]|uniref:Glycosyltransferase family 2 protein n=1 Tax=Roseiconus lacunae TaxID=2605694 RepID=A0ABT7PQ51_9BACT|nr:glycosyltransferase family 2 protein [Roseiconus lacunae]MCD0462804.1 glycosyltransferase family 2 protein [Roseiconus lacunae]MDM4018629.1 glycosyltransferase family 2 protein [Roseiconus lacunae]WRQ51397.1 glycosyltransferase family 2 protein [Stieleria sp. HD01]